MTRRKVVRATSTPEEIEAAVGDWSGIRFSRLVDAWPDAPWPDVRAADTDAVRAAAPPHVIITALRAEVAQLGAVLNDERRRRVAAEKARAELVAAVRLVSATTGQPLTIDDLGQLV